MWAKRALMFAAVAAGLLVIGASGEALGVQVVSGKADPSAVASQLPGPSVGGEVASLRTRDSRTYQVSDGSLRAVVYPGPINYPDGNGGWLPIDNSLVASTRPGYAFQNKANSVELSLPADLGQEPVRVDDGSDWVTFGLAGASGAPSVSGVTATYSDVLPGVSLTYAAVGGSVEESISLRDATAAAQPLLFNVSASQGLTATKAASGAISFVDAAGRSVFSFAAPSIADASGTDAEFSSSAISYQLTKTASGYTVAVIPATSFLAASAVQWPVTLDPTVVAADTQDCYITSGVNANDNYCTATAAKIRIGYQSSDTEARRGLLVFDVSGIPSESTVEDAQLAMNLQAETTSASAHYRVFRLIQSWTNGATWNKYDGTHTWATAGGDYNATVYADTPVGGSLGTTYWYPTKLVQGWVDGQFANDGLLIKQQNEATTNLLDFTSIENSNSSLWPTLTVDYANRAGQANYWTYSDQQLNDRMDLHVNVANGDLVVHAQDLHIAGTDGMDLSVDRYYNSNLTPNQDFGASTGWQMGLGSGVQLTTEASGDVVINLPSGTRALFQQDGSTYDSPAGVAGTLKQDTGGTYELDWNSGEVWQFNPSGDLASDTDRNQNAITYTYNGGNNLTTITDTQGRTVSFTRTGGYVTGMSDNAGSRSFGYGYDTSNRLTTYTDPSLNNTQYAYNSSNNLSKITDPRGHDI